MTYRFFRLVPRSHTSRVGRRYYKIVSYPQDQAELSSPEEARNFAVRRKYQAILGPGHTWIALTEPAGQCINWHNAGKENYVNVY